MACYKNSTDTKTEGKLWADMFPPLNQNQHRTHTDTRAYPRRSHSIALVILPSCHPTQPPTQPRA